MSFDGIDFAQLGWPKTKYASVERERRWLCKVIPNEIVLKRETLNDLYIEGTQLRLRQVRGGGDNLIQFKLSRKADIDASRRIISTLYLTEFEFSLFSQLRGSRLQKLRHHIIGLDGTSISIDQFAGSLNGLLLAEVEFETDADMIAYRAPDFMGREVTGESEWTGGCLVTRGMPNM